MPSPFTLWKGNNLIYTWRIMEGRVPNIGEPSRNGVKKKAYSTRTSVYCTNSQTLCSAMHVHYPSIDVHCPRIFNYLPAAIHWLFLGHFNRYLAKYLRICTWRTSDFRMCSNQWEELSLLDAVQFAGAQLVSIMEKPYEMSVARGDHR